MTRHKKSTPKSNDMKRRLIGLSFLAVNSFLLVSFILTKSGNGSQDQIGLAGGFLSRTLIGLFGKAGIVVPCVGLLLGILFLAGYREENIRTNLVGFFLVLFSILGIFSVDAIATLTFVQGIKTGIAGEGGGVLGMALSW